MALPDIVVRPADANDLQRILTLVESTPGAPHWSSSIWQRIFQSPAFGAQRIVLIAESSNECVGFGVLGLAGEDAEIENVAVSTAWRRRGIARQLCNALLNWARAQHATDTVLEVRVSNAPARALYRSLNFHEIGTRRGYYRDPEEDAIVMSAAL